MAPNWKLNFFIMLVLLMMILSDVAQASSYAVKTAGTMLSANDRSSLTATCHKNSEKPLNGKCSASSGVVGHGYAEGNTWAYEFQSLKPIDAEAPVNTVFIQASAECN